jgi:SMODS-associating 2TM, beta-strand rich effector domain
MPEPLVKSIAMLHLLSIRLVLTLAGVLVGGAVLMASYVWLVGSGDAIRDALFLVRWALLGALLTLALLFVAWRWSAIAQKLIFPYLGGSWAGYVEFAGTEGDERRTVRLEIKHTLLRLRLFLDSKESMSWTVLVHADRREFEQYRLYYVYLNERKESSRP